MIAHFETRLEELPSTSSVFNGLTLSTRVIPARSAARGGDWCETFVLSQDVVALSIGDVCGHGVDSFATMVAVRQVIRDAAQRGLGPAQTLAAANRFLCGYHPKTCATAVFALLDTRGRTITFSNAGHPPPLMAGRAGAAFLEFPFKDFPLGVHAGLVPIRRVVNIPPETLLVFYTDGVTERDRRLLQGEVELCNAAMFVHRYLALPAAAFIEKQMFLTGSNLDDVAILTAWTPRAPPIRRSLRRPDTSLSLIRGALRSVQLIDAYQGVDQSTSRTVGSVR